MTSRSRLTCVTEVERALKGMREYPVLDSPQHGDDRERLRDLAIELRRLAGEAEDLARHLNDSLTITVPLHSYL